MQGNSSGTASLKPKQRKMFTVILWILLQILARRAKRLLWIGEHRTTKPLVRFSLPTYRNLWPWQRQPCSAVIEGKAFLHRIRQDGESWRPRVLHR